MIQDIKRNERKRIKQEKIIRVYFYTFEHLKRRLSPVLVHIFL